MLVPTKIIYCRDWQLIWLADHFDMDAFRQTDLFVGTEFTALDVLKTTTAGVPKNTEVTQAGAPAEGERRAVLSNLIVK